MKITRDEFLALQKQNSMSINSVGYRLIITPHFEYHENMTKEEILAIERLNEPIEFDYVSSSSISSQANITSYPIVTGDTIADHMTRQAKTIRISGTYSEYGNKPTNFVGSNDRLTNIQDRFERIQNDGIMCSIVTMKRGDKNLSKQKFKARDNMVLTSIQWTEHQASLDFDFSFTEALTVQVEEQPFVSTEDENLPNPTDATMLDFTDTLLDFTSIDQIIVNELYAAGLIDEKFLSNDVQNYLTSQDSYALEYVGNVVGSTVIGAGSVAVGAVLAKLVVSGLAGGPLTFGITAAVGAIAGGILALINSIKRNKAETKYGIEKFRHYDNNERSKQEVERFGNYLVNIHNQLNILEQSLQVYGITSNIEQECLTNIDGEYYTFTFTKNNVMSDKNKTIWSLDVVALNDKTNKPHVSISDVSSKMVSSIDKCDTTNYIFTTKQNHFYIYLINDKLFEVEHIDGVSNSERNTKIQECKNDLTNYLIFISEVNMTNFNEKLKQIVINSMKV